MNKPNAQVMNDLLNISAIMMKDPEGAAVLGVWHSMEAIATVLPDGCVCLAPGVPMTAPDIAAYFHFPADARRGPQSPDGINRCQTPQRSHRQD